MQYARHLLVRKGDRYHRACDAWCSWRVSGSRAWRRRARRPDEVTCKRCVKTQAYKKFLERSKDEMFKF